MTWEDRYDDIDTSDGSVGKTDVPQKECSVCDGPIQRGDEQWHLGEPVHPGCHPYR